MIQSDFPSRQRAELVMHLGRATLDVLANHEDGISRRTFDPSWLRSQASR